MPLTAAASLLDALRSTQLLRPAQLEILMKEGTDQFTEARVLAQHLMQRGWLTPFQANQLLLERANELFLGPYLLCERLGEGSAGTVFKAKHLRMNRVVALRVVRKELLANTESVEQFYREVEAASKLDHDNVVHAYDAGPIGPTHFLATEYISGTDFNRLVRECGPLPWAQATSYVYQAALGLQHGLERKLVHRNLKPSKFIVTSCSTDAKPSSTQALREAPPKLPTPDSPGTIKIVDLGLARLSWRAEGTNSSAGSAEPCYLAPEQLADAHLSDCQADLFSLGCTYYYLVTGKHPYTSDPSRPPPAPPEQLEPEIPPAVAAVINRMMDVLATNRYQGPGEVAQVLQEFVQATQPKPAGPLFAESDSSERVVKVKRKKAVAKPKVQEVQSWRRFAIAGSALVGLVLLVLLALFLAFFPGASKTTVEKAPSVQLGLRDLKTRARTPANDGGQLWKEVAHFRGEFAGTPEAREASELLLRLPTPLNRLDGQQISAEDRALAGDLKDLVAVFGEQRWRVWQSPVRAVAYVRDGKSIALTTGNTVRFWDAATGQEQAALKGHQGIVTSMALTPDGKLLVTGGTDKQIKIWNVATATASVSFQASHEVGAVAVATDGQTIASGSKDGAIQLWSLTENKEIAKLAAHKGSVHSLDFSPDGKLLASGGQDGHAHLWNIETRKEAEVKQPPTHAGGVHAVLFLPGGELLATAGTDQWVKITRVANGAEHKKMKHGAVIHGLAVTRNGKALATAGSDGYIKVWDTGNGKEFKAFHDADGLAQHSVAFAADNQTLVSGNLGKAVRLYSLATDNLPAPQGNTRALTALAFAPDLETITSVNQNLYVWETASGKISRTIKPQQATVLGVAISPNGLTLASAGSDKTVRLFDPASGRELAFIPGYTAAIRAVAFAPDGRTLATGTDDSKVRLWDLVSNSERVILKSPVHSKPVRSLAFAPDGLRLATASLDQTVKLWDATTGAELLTIPGNAADFAGVAFAPDGQMLATIGAGKTIRLINASNGRETIKLIGHLAPPVSLAFSPDGQLLVSLGSDGQIILWKTPGGGRLRDWQLPGGASSVVFAPDGRHIITANDNGTVYVFRLASSNPQR